MRMKLMLLACVFAPAMAASQQPEEKHGHGVHSHRGPGPHFIDAFFTENAYIERKVRPDLFVQIGEEGDHYTAQLEVEWALWRNFSVIVHAPFVQHVSPTDGAGQTGIGDLSIGPKLAVINDREAFILALGGDLAIPTGDAERGLGEEHAAAAPFLLAWLPFGPDRRWLAQSGVHIDVPLEGDEHAHAEVSAALSWTSPLGVTPIIEAISEFSVEGGPTSWAVAPEVRWEFAPAWEVGAAVRVPVGGPREEDVRIAVGVIRHFALPQ